MPSPAVDLLLNERQVVTREVRGGYYNPSAYLLSKLTLDASECVGVPLSASSLWPMCHTLALLRQQITRLPTLRLLLLPGTCCEKGRHLLARLPPTPAHICAPVACRSPAALHPRHPLLPALLLPGRLQDRCAACCLQRCGSLVLRQLWLAQQVHDNPLLLPLLALPAALSLCATAGAAYAAAYCFILITFSCTVGAMSMSVTGGWVAVRLDG